MSDKKTEYAEFCLIEKTLPIFMQNWWLNAVCTDPNNWQPIVSKDKNGNIDAVLIAHVKKKYFFFKTMGEPVLTQFSGILLREKNIEKRSKKYFFVKTHLEALIAQIPKADRYFFRLQHTITDAQPFFWSGFDTLVRYTFRLENIKNTAALMAQMTIDTRRNIIKGAKHYDREISEDREIFVQLHNTIFVRQNKKLPVSDATWQKLDAALSEKKARTILLARNKSTGTYDAGVYLVQDCDTAYYLAAGCNDSGRQYGGLYFLLWQAIQLAAESVDTFDFEGTMLRTVEPVFRGFGGIQTPYLTIQKKIFAKLNSL